MELKKQIIFNIKFWLMSITFIISSHRRTEPLGYITFSLWHWMQYHAIIAKAVFKRRRLGIQRTQLALGNSYALSPLKHWWNVLIRWNKITNVVLSNKKNMSKWTQCLGMTFHTSRSSMAYLPSLTRFLKPWTNFVYSINQQSYGTRYRVSASARTVI